MNTTNAPMTDAVRASPSTEGLGSGVSIRTGAADLPTHCWPANKQAARETWAPMPERFTSRQRPALCPVPVAEIQRRNCGYKGRPAEPFRDLTGQRNGAMVIVGLIAYREQKRSSWAALCDCGNYEQRNHRNWQRYMRRGVPDACGHCMPEELRRAVVRQFWGSTEEPNGLRKAGRCTAATKRGTAGGGPLVRVVRLCPKLKEDDDHGNDLAAAEPGNGDWRCWQAHRCGGAICDAWRVPADCRSAQRQAGRAAASVRASDCD